MHTKQKLIRLRNSGFTVSGKAETNAKVNDAAKESAIKSHNTISIQHIHVQPLLSHMEGAETIIKTLSHTDYEVRTITLDKEKSKQQPDIKTSPDLKHYDLQSLCQYITANISTLAQILLRDDFNKQVNTFMYKKSPYVSTPCKERIFRHLPAL